MSSKFQLPSQLKAVPQELPQVAPEDLREFLAGAKDHRSSPEALPWDKFDPEALPRHNVSVRLNDYYMAMLKYLAKELDISQQKVMNRILRPQIEQQARALSSELSDSVKFFNKIY